MPRISCGLLIRDNVPTDATVHHNTIVTRLMISTVGGEADAVEQDRLGAMIGSRSHSPRFPVRSFLVWRSNG
jgi:hypothetical protein